MEKVLGSKDSEGRTIIHLKTTESIPQETTVEFNQLCMDVVNARNGLKAAKTRLNEAMKSLNASEKAEWKEFIDRANKED